MTGLATLNNETYLIITAALEKLKLSEYNFFIYHSFNTLLPLGRT